MWSVVMWGDLTWFMRSDFILKWSEVKLKWSEVKCELRWIPCGHRCYVHYGDLILRELDYIVIISFRYILYCVCFNLYCGGSKLFCNVCVCVWVGFVMCGCLDNVYTLNLFGYHDRFFRAFPSVVRQMPGYNSQRLGTANTLPGLLFVLFCLLFMLFCC
jgi:hypothetical protein